MLTIEVKDRWDNENKIIVMIEKIEHITEYRGLATIHLTSGKSIEVWHGSEAVREMIESSKVCQTIKNQQ